MLLHTSKPTTHVVGSWNGRPLALRTHARLTPTTRLPKRQGVLGPES